MPVAIGAAIALTLGGCATDAADPATADDTSALRCDPFCDPDQGTDHEDTLQGAYDYGYALFSDAVARSQNCDDFGSGNTSTWDCMVTFTSARSSCGSFVVECIETHGRRSCNSMASHCQF
ncbi:MAG TPA: hypothetical protein VHW23_45955 [Kofleriaceae bacterium]|jgi:hypothetical protein|nr:hypothetical protein [Kofleriaceae bacterium]